MLKDKLREIKIVPFQHRIIRCLSACSSVDNHLRTAGLELLPVFVTTPNVNPAPKISFVTSNNHARVNPSGIEIFD